MAVSRNDAYQPDGWAWPFVEQRSYGIGIAGAPPASPYCGPYSSTGDYADITLPPSLRYARITLHQPVAAWQLGRRLRAMATQIVTHAAREAYPRDVVGRLRQAGATLTIAPLEQVHLPSAREILANNPTLGRANWLDVGLGAQRGGFGCVLAAVSNDDLRLQAFYIGLKDATRSYSLMTVRAPDAHPAASTALHDAVLTWSEGSGCLHHDFQAGYLPGVRGFHARLGAKPHWYGQARLTRGTVVGALEWLRSRTNPARL